MTALLFAGRLARALPGAVVGLEHQWRQRTAGTRTNALVARGCLSIRDGWAVARRRAICPWQNRILCGFWCRLPCAGVIFKEWQHTRSEHRSHNLVLGSNRCSGRFRCSPPFLAPDSGGHLHQYSPSPARISAALSPARGDSGRNHLQSKFDLPRC
jgi:hypothetical protein